MTRFFIAVFLALLSTHSLTAQAPEGSPRGDSAVTVAPGDLLRIVVWPDSMLSGRYPVEDNGTVTLPEVGELRVVGKDIRAIRANLRELYGRLRKTAIVSVTPVFRVGVLGQVQRPGLYEVESTMTWFDVISLAGGFTGSAARDRVAVIRGGRELLVNAVATDVAAMSTLNVQVRSGDKLIVPEREQHNWSLTLSIVQIIAVLATIALQLRH